jgi:adenine-specific DNA-methyltransferase
MPTVEQLRTRLIDKLKELFQLDQPDLDFGFYRIMHAKSKQVTEFLENDLLKIVETAFTEGGEQRIAALRKEYEDAIAKAKEFGAADPEATEPVKKAKAALDAAADTSKAEAEVYDHLYRFFERYYEDGDFISRRYYRRETDSHHPPFGIPYYGEEVKLHWTNADQYYIKTAEHFSNYTFDLTKSNEVDALKLELFGDEEPKPRLVRFRIVEATEGEHGNIKASEKTKRYFIIHEPDPLSLENGELVVRFEFRPDPEKTGKDNTWREKRNAESVQLILATLEAQAATDEEAADYLRLLKTPAPTDTQKDRPLLARYINQYTARNTMDYFIHKDLGGFLRRELDFYIKNEVIRLDDIASAKAPVVVEYLDRLKVLRQVATKLIEFLSQLEEFQRRLWLKRKFVVQTHYCVTLDNVLQFPENVRNSLLDSFAANQALHDEWVRLFAIDKITAVNLGDVAYSQPLTRDFLIANSGLVVDTALLPEHERNTLLSHIDHIDKAQTGLAIKGENLQALRLAGRRYSNAVKAIYIDPPYNTKKDRFPYKDGYRSASWLTLLRDRLVLARKLLRDDGVIWCSIDTNELCDLELLLDETFLPENRVGDIIWRNARDNNPTRIATEHEYVLCFARNINTTEQVWKNEFADAKELLIAAYDALRAKGLAPKDIQRELRKFIKDNKQLLSEVDRYKFVDEGGVYTGSQSVHNPHPGGYEYDILHPTTQRPMRLPATGYRFPEETMRRDYIEKDRLLYGPDENRIVQIKLYLKDYKDSLRSVIDLDGRLGAYALNALFGNGTSVYENPKPPELLERLLAFSSQPETLVLDFFAGSGTTIQSVLGIARQTDVDMRFVAVEISDAFEEVLLSSHEEGCLCQGLEGRSANRPFGKILYRQVHAS